MGFINILTYLSVVISLSSVIVGANIPTTLDGPFTPVTIPLDQSFRGQAKDLPSSDPRLQAKVEQYHPEQISVSLSFNYDSVWVSWISGTLSCSISYRYFVLFFSSHYVGSVFSNDT